MLHSTHAHLYEDHGQPSMGPQQKSVVDNNGPEKLMDNNGKMVCQKKSLHLIQPNKNEYFMQV